MLKSVRDGPNESTHVVSLPKIFVLATDLKKSVKLADGALINDANYFNPAAVFFIILY